MFGKIIAQIFNVEGILSELFDANYADSCSGSSRSKRLAPHPPLWLRRTVKPHRQSGHLTQKYVVRSRQWCAVYKSIARRRRNTSSTFQQEWRTLRGREGMEVISNQLPKSSATQQTITYIIALRLVDSCRSHNIIRLKKVPALFQYENNNYVRNANKTFAQAKKIPPHPSENVGVYSLNSTLGTVTGNFRWPALITGMVS